MSKKCHIVFSNHEYNQLFKELGYELVDYILSEQLEPVDLVVFTGGEDVTPILYGAKAHPTTYNSVERDIFEKSVFDTCILNNIPMVGICRGAQFLNVMSGGAMYQNVQAHTRPHYINDCATGETIYVSSTHHQMMKPSDKAELVAFSTLGGKREWFEGDVYCHDLSTKDIEVVYYQHTKSLCFQPHPEFDSVEYEGMKMYFKSLLERYYV